MSMTCTLAYFCSAHSRSKTYGTFFCPLSEHPSDKLSSGILCRAPISELEPVEERCESKKLQLLWNLVKQTQFYIYFAIHHPCLLFFYSHLYSGWYSFTEFLLLHASPSISHTVWKNLNRVLNVQNLYIYRYSFLLLIFLTQSIKYH